MPLELKLKATETPIRSELRPFPMASNEGRYPDILTDHQQNKKKRLYRTLYRPVSETARKMLRLIGKHLPRKTEKYIYFFTQTSRLRRVLSNGEALPRTHTPTQKQDGNNYNQTTYKSNISSEDRNIWGYLRNFTRTTTDPPSTTFHLLVISFVTHTHESLHSL